MILAPTNRRIIRPYDKPSFEHTQRYGLIKGHPLGPAGGLVFFLIMNEGSGGKVFDLSDNGNIGTLVADTHFVSGKFGSALDFDGTGDYVTIPLPSGLATTNPITVIFWGKASSNTAEVTGVHVQGASGDAGQILSIDLIPNQGKLRISHLYGSLFGRISSAVDLLKWHQFAATNAGGNVASDIYIDAILDNVATTRFHPTAEVNKIILGKAGDYSDLDGLIDHIMIYNRVLNASEIALPYREPFCMVQKKAAPVYFFVPIVGGVVYDETGLVVSVACSISEADNQQMDDTSKAISFAASITETDTQQMLDTNKAVTFAASISETDAQQMVDTDLGITVAASLGISDTQQMFDIDLGVSFAASIAETDTQQMKDLLKGVTFAASVSKMDTQQMKDLLKAVTFAASCSIETEVYYDASAAVFAMFAFIILRQHTS